ncbi:MAG: phosphoribosylaminoimidazole carboxylase [Chloroflexi bacterium]|nr:MAG: phosphoribosylaminoimidazole carboxylase [Chloroflexota bacterium]
MPRLRPHLLGRHPLAAHARGFRGTVKDVLRRLKAGELTEDEALDELRSIQLEDLAGRARLDLGRYLRRGIPEVVLALGKTPEETARLVVTMAGRQGQGLVSRMTKEHVGAVNAAAREAEMKVITYSSSARVLREGFSPEAVEGKVGILTAGTSDVVVADEARMVAESCGFVAAGMDGVLPGLVAGLVALPVIGLPVSTGYGRGGAGEAALLTMLQSCSTGLTVVNIDNGVGAGAAAVLVASRAAQGRRRGRNAATIAPTMATTSNKPNSAAARPREKSTPPGIANARARTRTATKTPTSSHGKPRRRRP